MASASSPSGKKSWHKRRVPVSVIAEMALRQKNVSERLEALRLKHGLTQEQAAAKVGVTNRQWQRWAAGDSMPYPRNLDQIASRFGISVEDFFDPEGEGPALDAPSQLDRVEEKLDQLLRRLVDEKPRAPGVAVRRELEGDPPSLGGRPQSPSRPAKDSRPGSA